MKSNCYFFSLSEELQLEIFNYLDKQVGADISLVCQHLSQISQDTNLNLLIAKSDYAKRA